MFNIKCCRWLDSNHRPLELEATALPTEPQPLPMKKYFDVSISEIVCRYAVAIIISNFGEI